MIAEFVMQLQRRSVFRAAVAHVVVFWVLVQVADVVLPYLGIVDNPVRWAVVAGVALFPITLVVSWFVEHPWNTYTRSRVAIDIVVISVIAVTTIAWAVRNLPSVVQMKTSIVVLPFQHTGGSLEQSLSRALAYEVNSLLMKSKAIDVTGFESASSPALRGLEAPGIAERLSVAYVLSGTVAVTDGTMNIAVELLDSAGQAWWNSVIEESIDNLFSVQERIALAVESRLGAGEKAVPVTEIAAQRCWMPTDATALENYYTARYYVELRSDSEESRAQIQDAIALYGHLVNEYPRFADAHSGLAWALMHQTIYDRQNAMPPGELQPRVTSLAEAALAHCPSLGEAMHLLPNEYDHENAWIGQHQQLTAFLEMQPDRAEYYQRLARHYRETGLVDRAVEVAERNYALNPLSPKALRILSGVYQYADRLDEAVELADRAAELGSTSPNFARAARQMEACREDIECLLENLPPPFLPHKDAMRQIATEPDVAVEIAMGLFRESPGMWVNWFNASSCNVAHLTPLFFELWEANREVGAYWHWPNVWMSGCDNVWSDPRFPGFVEEAGLVEYWNKVGWPAMCALEGIDVQCGGR